MNVVETLQRHSRIDTRNLQARRKLDAGSIARVAGAFVRGLRCLQGVDADLSFPSRNGEQLEHFTSKRRCSKVDDGKVA